ncbi:hypothetical protein SCUCBS95973_004233 [Sporothrix curviconia]|uniref:Uncharacterized protein n=1 Tax=Sporothrix curviconia TaxID=1260050 RepID=A0ABP0BNF9_9PEZI
MTRLGPLTSQALGRSPYDILVPGTGEANPREPPQTYDERGRPYNTDTRRINRNIIRAHNEVMQVIGVAEPDSLLAAESEANNQLIQQLHEDRLGHKLYVPMRIIGAVGVWGAEPLRQRALLFREYNNHLPWSRFRQDYGAKTILRTLAVGLTAGLTDNYLRHVALSWKAKDKYIWGQWALTYVRVHLQIFTCLQRLSILPPTPILPWPLFFVPFSGHSPITCSVPFPTSPSFGGVADWLLGAVVGAVPFAAFYAFMLVQDHLMHNLNYLIYGSLDTPSNPPMRRPISEYDPVTDEWRLAGLPMVEVLPPRPAVPPLPTITSSQAPPLEHPSTARGERPAIPPPPAESQRPFTDTVDNGSGNNDDGTTARRNAIEGREEDRGAASGSSAATPTQDQQSTTRTPGSPNTGPRRRNTVSSGGGGDGYNSDEEDFELSATLISFDVEAGPGGGDAPPNAWSAELRQAAAVSIGFESNEVYMGDVNVVDDDDGDDGLGPEGNYDEQDGSRPRVGRQPGAYIRGVYYPNVPAPFFSDTMLTRLPATMFAAGAASVGVSLITTEVEATMLRLLARSWRLQQNLPVYDLYDVSPMPYVPGVSGDGVLALNAASHYAFAILLEAAVQAMGTLVSLGLAWLFRGSHPKWTFWRVVREKLGYGTHKELGPPPPDV